MENTLGEMFEMNLRCKGDLVKKIDGERDKKNHFAKFILKSTRQGVFGET